MPEYDERSDVYLTLLKSSVNRCEHLVGDIASVDNVHDPHNTLTIFKFPRVISAELPFLGKLHNMGIAHSVSWRATPSIIPGSTHLRFNAVGEFQLLYVAHSKENPPIKELMELITEPKKLADYVRTYNERVTPWHWDNQEDYGGRYFARKLIMPIDYIEPEEETQESIRTPFLL